MATTKKSQIHYSKIDANGNVVASDYAKTAVKAAPRILGNISSSQTAGKKVNKRKA